MCKVGPVRDLTPPEHPACTLHFPTPEHLSRPFAQDTLYSVRGLHDGHCV